MGQDRWDCVVFHSELAGGKGSGYIQITPQGLWIKTFQGKEFEMGFSKLEVEFGKTARFFLKTQGKEEPVVACRAVHLLYKLREKNLPLRTKELVEKAISKRRQRIAYLVSTALFSFSLIVFFLLYLVWYGPTLALQAVPYSVDRALGEAALPSALQEFGGRVFQSQELQKEVQKIVDRLLQGVENSPFTFDVRVVKSRVPNAFALPGGKIVILTGILKQADTPEEVAGVLAHEIGHVMKRHGVRMILQNIGLWVLAMVILGDSSTISHVLLVDGARKLLSLKFSRSMEVEADRFAFELMKKTKVDPRGIIQFFKKLHELEKRMPFRIPRWLSTHPLTKDRIQSFERWIREEWTGESQPLLVDWQKVKTLVGEGRRS